MSVAHLIYSWGVEDVKTVDARTLSVGYLVLVLFAFCSLRSSSQTTCSPRTSIKNVFTTAAIRFSTTQRNKSSADGIHCFRNNWLHPECSNRCPSKGFNRDEWQHNSNFRGSGTNDSTTPVSATRCSTVANTI